MTRIAVLGGTGFGGDAVVREAVRRGHVVTSYSRRPPSEPVLGAEYVTGSLLDPELLAQSARLFDLSAPPPEVLPEIQTGLAQLEALQRSPESLDWFYVSPAAEFGAWLPQRVTGRYRISEDVLPTDEAGESHVSAADLALAVVDEIEQPRFHRRRFHVAH